MNISIKQILPFIVLAGLCAILLSITHLLTKQHVSENIEREKLHVISAVMTADFDNDIYHDVKVISYTDDSGNELMTNVYRARKSGNPVGAVFMPIPAKGYNGTIELSIGILEGGLLYGVQVLTHQETEGLDGDIHQDKTDWLKHFAKQSFDITPVESWNVKSESGAFDHISGATITSRGVINAVKNSLKLYLDEQESLFSD
jgi:Na+-translocating ferredoxin:NAD+ oxidoreductase subunit G